MPISKGLVESSRLRAQVRERVEDPPLLFELLECLLTGVELRKFPAPLRELDLRVESPRVVRTSTTTRRGALWGRFVL